MILSTYIYQRSSKIWVQMEEKLLKRKVKGLRATQHLRVPQKIREILWNILTLADQSFLKEDISGRCRLGKASEFFIFKGIFTKSKLIVCFSRRIKLNLPFREKLYHETMNPSKHQTSNSEYSNSRLMLVATFYFQGWRRGRCSWLSSASSWSRELGS